MKHPEIVKGRAKEPHWWTQRRFGSQAFSGYKIFFENGIIAINKSVDETGFHPLVATEGSASTVWDNSTLFSENSYDDPPCLNIHVIQSNANLDYPDYSESRLLYFQKTYIPEEFHLQVAHLCKIFNECLEKPEKRRLCIVCMHRQRRPVSQSCTVV